MLQYIIYKKSVRTPRDPWSSVNKMIPASMKLPEFQKYSFKSEIEIISTMTEFLKIISIGENYFILNL